MNKVFNRSVQIILKTLSPLLDWSEPELHTGSGSLNNLPKLLKEKQHNRMLIVTDKGIIKVGLLDSFIQQLEEENITYRIYDAVEPIYPVPVMFSEEDFKPAYRIVKGATDGKTN